MSEQELAALRRSLEHERAALIDAIDSRRAAASEEQVEAETLDIAAREIKRADDLRVAAFDDALLADVERALAKIEAGTYGFSEESGHPIPVERLHAIPWARRTREEEARRHGHRG